ncbi:E3 ubiquitin-protein ligase ZNF598 [Daktulosphaira vitifoliae]|uniref:E3 ubiquitin-protein ligase ZNF598 n=1 Tax=Daktulosphaira vitifoliae TaxID=58002 RepID=UPI0021AA5182|nr:E3 ubiquitin-protein ligase ZNF598 [Daktulosphaira vitifoliae]XP_050542095.1 E3 ubiquitin-protein ligase ZNF598 [Daktulosphaira vitifoliae]XP_050542096.1 E3 ubiquitin-protein ligase ZNF598 [Daktulosphaira vitifoliae]XP_050542097.1 E3 ubiquitin-protein ligase ZNF598 [Daktulosphaira vitifoliae]
MNRRPQSYNYKPHSTSSKPTGPSCVICFKPQSIYSIGACDHPVCYECSTTMRVLCDQKECPICRRIMTKVIFTKKIELFQDLENRQYPRYNKKFGIAFDDHSIENSFEQLLRCYCKKCYDRPNFEVFEQLTTHMERNHRLYACRLCVKHLKIFPSQRRWYNYDELARHEECGDPDNTSHRGHPECHFCNVRYLDKDELYKHLRKEHFYCHFCDADGIQDYYMTYAWLRKHYYDKHFLCEEGNCVNEQFTSVFRTAIDLQAHKAQAHSKELGKHGSKEARTLKIEFNLRPRHLPVVEAGRPNLNQYPPLSDFPMNHNPPPERVINVRNTSDFPSLNGQTTTVLPCARTRKQNQHVNTRDLNSFPALGQESALPPKPVQSANNIRMAAILKKPPELPKQEKNKENSGPSIRLPNQAKDFPSLDGNQSQAKVKEVNNSNSWVSKAKITNEEQEALKKSKKEAPIKKKIAEAPKVPGPSDFPNLNKKLEPTKSNLAKLGNKKKTEVIKKSNNTVDNTLNTQKKVIQTDSFSQKENLSQKNDKVKSKDAHSNGDIQSKIAKNEVNPGRSNKIDTKKELNKKSVKENQSSPVKPDKLANVASNQKEKKKRKKNDNKHLTPEYENSNVEVSSTPKVPPGFENAQQIRVPPGLSSRSQIKAPPGLTLNKSYDYILPPNSTIRNKVLINNLVAALIPRDDQFDTFEKFKEMSTLFRKNVITAYDFYSYCVEAICRINFETVFLELVLLLPDIQKQQELLFIYNRNGGEKLNVELCKVCRQVLKPSDLDHHLSLHNI